MAGSKVNVKFRGKELVQKQRRAFDAANAELEANFAYEIAQPHWDWPRATVRSDGSVAGSPRSAVDTGQLLDSYARRKEGVGRYVHSWDVPWAVIVHNGMVTRSGETLPPRPFTLRPIQALPELFARKYREDAG